MKFTLTTFLPFLGATLVQSAPFWGEVANSTVLSSNAIESQFQNELYAAGVITTKTDCEVGEAACISNFVMKCVDGHFSVSEQCKLPLKCYSVPKIWGVGTFVTCTTAEKVQAMTFP